MLINKLIEGPTELTDQTDLDASVVLSTRVRLARNIQGFPFPTRAKMSQRRDILATCSQALASLPEVSKGFVLKLSELNDLEKLILVERHLVSRELIGAKEGGGVCISSDQSFAAMINEEDHLRLQLIRRGFGLMEAWQQINDTDSAIEDYLDYAFSEELGYLTACPTNVGTGLRASAMMHLPGLVISEQMDRVVRALNQLGIAVRGLFGEGSDASGHIFQISNQQTLGETEEEIISRLQGVFTDIIQQEENARAKLWKKSFSKIADKIGRATGILQNAHTLSSAEALNLLSFVRLATDYRILPIETRRLIDRLIIEAQPGHIQFNANRKVEPEERDIERAKLFREHFSKLTPLDFDRSC